MYYYCGQLIVDAQGMEYLNAILLWMILRKEYEVINKKLPLGKAATATHDLAG